MPRLTTVAIDDDNPDFDHLTPKPLDQGSAYAILLAHMLTGNELQVESLQVTR